ncbi:vWA domain-containing protein [Saltatorellus ferox]|uniref:vWA domain-containing protein n=1 Tax=Saltatorellus ferox TaxID=2528018 RepID=UPI003AF35339
MSVSQGLEHRLGSIESSIDLWGRVPAGWNGLTTPGVDRFMESLEVVCDPSRSEATRQTVLRGREFALRAAALMEEGMESEGLQAVSARSEALLERALAKDESVVDWGLMEIVAWDSSQNESRRPGSDWRPTTRERRLMLELLAGQKVEKLRGPLLAIARRDADPLREAALGHLARWATDFEPDEVVDLFLVKLLGRSSDYRHGPQPMNVILERIDSSDVPLGVRAQEALRSRIAQLLISPDWRNAAIGLRLSAGLDVSNRVPMLLDGLNVWNQRHLSKRPFTSMVRIRGDLVRALRGISDLKHGPQPGPWIDWWVEVRQGKRPMPGTAEFEEERSARRAEPRSSAGFFGLKPTTDRVTFIIDHSGSMDNTWGTTDRTRYEQAIDQMLRFLQGSEPGTEFNVILFDDVPLRSSLGLVEATPENLERARKSLLDRSPGGSTHLRPAIELALGLGPDGLPVPLEEGSDGGSLADTIVVLCDGATAEGARWVEPVLKRALPLYPVVFHTVHLGPSDDGALSALARISGGEFMRVGS